MNMRVKGENQNLNPIVREEGASLNKMIIERETIEAVKCLL